MNVYSNSTTGSLTAGSIESRVLRNTYALLALTLGAVIVKVTVASMD